jgi:hypothetical protein
VTTELERAGDLAAVAAYLGLDPADIKARAVVAVANRYGLDPLLGHVEIVKQKVYVSRDGLLHVAHQSGVLDGIVVEEQRESENGYSATVTVWRRDMTHGFTYKGGCGVNEPQAANGYGAEMALARAERRALLRAFDIPAYDAEQPIPEYVEPEHRMLDLGDAKDPWLVCSCGEKFQTNAAFAAHLEPATAPSAGTADRSSRRRRIDRPPDDYYDSLPEAQGRA